MTFRGKPFEVRKAERCKLNDIFCRSQAARLEPLLPEIFSWGPRISSAPPSLHAP